MLAERHAHKTCPLLVRSTAAGKEKRQNLCQVHVVIKKITLHRESQCYKNDSMIIERTIKGFERFLLVQTHADYDSVLWPNLSAWHLLMNATIKYTWHIWFTFCSRVDSELTHFLISQTVLEFWTETLSIKCSDLHLSVMNTFSLK